MGADNDLGRGLEGGLAERETGGIESIGSKIVGWAKDRSSGAVRGEKTSPFLLIIR
jgi:hypothetical protein